MALLVLRKHPQMAAVVKIVPLTVTRPIYSGSTVISSLVATGLRSLSLVRNKNIRLNEPTSPTQPFGSIRPNRPVPKTRAEAQCEPKGCRSGSSNLIWGVLERPHTLPKSYDRPSQRWPWEVTNDEHALRSKTVAASPKTTNEAISCVMHSQMQLAVEAMKLDQLLLMLPYSTNPNSELTFVRTQIKGARREAAKMDMELDRMIEGSREAKTLARSADKAVFMDVVDMVARRHSMLQDRAEAVSTHLGRAIATMKDEVAWWNAETATEFLRRSIQSLSDEALNAAKECTDGLAEGTEAGDLSGESES